MRLLAWLWPCKEEDADIDSLPTPHSSNGIEAREALARAEENLDEGKVHLEEIRHRRIRLEKQRRENHLAPDIYEAFKKRRDV